MKCSPIHIELFTSYYFGERQTSIALNGQVRSPLMENYNVWEDRFSHCTSFFPALSVCALVMSYVIALGY